MHEQVTTEETIQKRDDHTERIFTATEGQEDETNLSLLLGKEAEGTCRNTGLLREGDSILIENLNTLEIFDEVLRNRSKISHLDTKKLPLS